MVHTLYSVLSYAISRLNMINDDSKMPMVGGIIAAIGAGICCVGPLVLLLLGISGSWISSLTAFEPYRPVFVVTVMLFLGYAGYKIHRPIEKCQPGSVCAIPQTRRRRQIAFWITSLIALVLITSNYWLVWLI